MREASGVGVSEGGRRAEWELVRKGSGVGVSEGG